MPSSFNHTPAGLTAGATRTVVYGPVPAGTSVIVFSGTCANVDTVGKAQHDITLESYNGATYTTHFSQLPIPYGATTKVPKIVMLPGESLYVTADAAGVVACRFELLVRT